MPISPDQTLLHYRIVEKIGEGGMGVVWKARDTTLERDVAIKVLPAEFQQDPERPVRFQREAKLLASLNHPHIASIYGLHEAEGIRFIAMELVPGEDLAERLGRGPLPLEEALEIARQVAEALETAHEQGVIHRDLKPANIKLGSDNQVKVLDFGLAKALAPAGGEAAADPMMSPTITSHTVPGMILGTVGYMSPEQARAQEVDQRADIWAFGCLLYEMLSGKRPYRGQTVSDTLAAVLTREPDWSELPETLPHRLRELIQRCLNKNPRMRLRDIGDARIELGVLAAEPAGDDLATAVDSASSRRGRRYVLAASALIAGLVLGAAAGYFASRDDVPARSAIDGPLRSHIVLPDDLPLATGSDVINAIELRSLAIAPDGSRLVYVAGGEGPRRLVQRRIGSFDADPIKGTEGGFSPSFSPDGRWVAFLTPSELKKVPLDGGDPVVLCEAHVGFSTSWAEDGYVYFTHHQEQLARVDDRGGEVETFDDQANVSTLHTLPGARGLLTNRRSQLSVRMDDAEIIHVDGQGRVTSILRGGYAPSYVPSGHLVFVRGGSLYAVDFDLDKLQTTGTPVSVLEGIATDSVWGGAQYDLSRNGVLVYLPRDDWALTRPTWIDRRGNLEPLDLPEQLYNNARLSRDGTKLAIHVTGASDQIQVYDFRRRTLARLTLGGGNTFPVWTKDGERIFFAGFGGGERGLYSQPLDGSADAERVLTDEHSAAVGGVAHFPNAVSPDGKLLLFCAVNPESSYDLWAASVEADEPPRPLLTGPGGEALGSFSPDGRWIVYMNDKTGRWEVYVRPFPDIDRREWRVSSGGGDDPMWSPGTNELFYRDGPRIYAVRYTTDPDFEPGPPELILDTDFHNSYGLSFDVSADGERFLVNRPVVAGQPNAPLRLIQNWTDELR